MALCKYGELISFSASQQFDRIWKPGAEARFEGIYRCVGCGTEVGVKGGTSLPDTRKRPHPVGCFGAQWKLLIAASIGRTSSADGS